jgi:hypothetical protein
VNLAELAGALETFRIEAERILSFNETSIHRTADLSASYTQVESLTREQAEMIRQSLRCVELGVFRAAHVMAWASVVDFLQRLADEDGFNQLNSKYTEWKIKSLDDLRDRFGEHNLVEAMHQSGMLNKSEKKALHSLLNKRNECAHPTDYYPDLNQSLGYVSECIFRLKALITKYQKVPA